MQRGPGICLPLVVPRKKLFNRWDATVDAILDRLWGVRTSRWHGGGLARSSHLRMFFWLNPIDVLLIARIRTREVSGRLDLEERGIARSEDTGAVIFDNLIGRIHLEFLLEIRVPRAIVGGDGRR
jgi:hypothetical protein